LIIAVDTFITGMMYSDSRSERITDLVVSIAMISGVIIYFIQFTKKNLRDIDRSVKEAEDKVTKEMGEIIQVIIFSAIILMPVWKIPLFIDIYKNMIESKDLIIEIGKAFGYSFMGIVLLLELNPLNIKKYIFTNNKKKYY